jgi:hypothetical protein
MKTKLIAVLMAFSVLNALAGPYGPHKHGEVTESEWEKILLKFHASGHGPQENWDKAEAEVARVHKLPSD